MQWRKNRQMPSMHYEKSSSCWYWCSSFVLIWRIAWSASNFRWFDFSIGSQLPFEMAAMASRRFLAAGVFDEHSLRWGTVPMLKKATLMVAASLPLLVGSVQAAAEQARPAGPAVMVHFDYYPKDAARIRALERRLESAIKRAGAGELGESELHVDGNDGYLYMFGPDADRLYRASASILKSSRLMDGAEVTERYAAGTKTFVVRTDEKRRGRRVESRSSSLFTVEEASPAV